MDKREGIDGGRKTQKDIWKREGKGRIEQRRAGAG